MPRGCILPRSSAKLIGRLVGRLSKNGALFESGKALLGTAAEARKLLELPEQVCQRQVGGLVQPGYFSAVYAQRIAACRSCQLNGACKRCTAWSDLGGWSVLPSTRPASAKASLTRVSKSGSHEPGVTSVKLV
jgi:hypothetical protein